jgi:hypothetical protein
MPPGGGGYGPPPGGGGYGPPPGGFGGPPPGGGYGPPPDGGGYGAPPGMMGGAGGQRVQFSGDGGKLLATFLIWGMGPPFAGALFVAVMAGLGIAVDHDRHGNPGGVAMLMIMIGVLAFYAVAIVGSILLQNKILEFRGENTIIDGQRLRYVGSAGGLFSTMFVNMILVSITFGIYAPWAVCKMWAWVDENTEVNGQRGRLTFHGDGATLLGKWIVGTILTSCTGGIYGAWFANDIFAFYWENTKLDGRGFGFRKDPGGFLGTYILTAILSYCTLGIYLPWGMCNIIKWECERVS